MSGPGRLLPRVLASLLVLGCGACAPVDSASRSGDEVEGPPLAGVTIRRVWSGARADAQGDISRDGRYFAYGHPSKNLTVRYVGRDEERLIASFYSLESWGQWTPQPVLSSSGIMAFLLGGQAFQRGPRGDRERWRRWRESFIELASGPERQVWALNLDRWRSASVLLNLERDEVRIFGWTPDEDRILAALGSSSGGWRLSFLRYVPDDPYTWGGEEVIRELEVIPEWAALSPGGELIAYDGSGRDGEGGKIRVVAADGTRRPALVTGPSDERLLGWSSSGVLYQTDASGRPCVRLLPMEGGEPSGPSRLVRCDLWGISPMGFTEDGSYWYGVRRGRREIYAADFDPVSRRLLSEPTPVSHQGAVEPSSVRWSPDGEFVAYLSWARRDRGGLHGPTLVVRALATGAARRFTPEAGAIDPGSLRWSPRGGVVLFTGVVEERGLIGIHVLDLAAGAQRVLPAYERWAGPAAGGAVWSWEGEGVLAGYTDRDGAMPPRRSILALDSSGAIRDRWPVPRKAVGQLTLVTPMDVVHGFQKYADRLFHTSLETGETRILWWMEEDYLVDMDRIPGTRTLLVATRSVKDPSHRHTRFWRLPLDTGEPERLDLEIEGLEDFDLHPAGDRIVFTADRSVEEVWVMEGLPGGE